MKFLTQTKFNTSASRGNCFTTCIACLLDMDIQDVPNVETLFEVSPSFHREVMQQWLNIKGYMMRSACEADIQEGAVYIAGGMTSRGIGHACLYQYGLLLHDPHPSKEGLVTVESQIVLERL
jgi:hypothetical protein